ncbi:hypothetical protein HYU92_03360 [Candidatus Curtissbacteria bacterium]|nr:hypothetical protein [Candidatus Curtissbacteria bacterium]
MAGERPCGSSGDDGGSPVATSSVEEPDLGLSHRDINVIIKFLEPHIAKGSSLPSIVSALEGQIRVVRRREEAAVQSLDRRRAAPKKSRRSVLAGAWRFLLGLAALAVTTYVAQDDDSFAAVERRVREAKEAFERDHTLGVNPSMGSTSGWKVRYPPRETNVDYEGSGRPFFVKSGDFINVPPRDNNDAGVSFILLREYTMANGVAVPELVVREHGPSDYTEQRWFLRNEPTDGIDTRVVVFERKRTDQTYFVAITGTDPEKTGFQLEIMNRIVR